MSQNQITAIATVGIDIGKGRPCALSVRHAYLSGGLPACRYC